MLAIPHLIACTFYGIAAGVVVSSSRGSHCSSRALSAGDVRLRREAPALLDARLRLPAGCSPTSTRRSRASAATAYPVDLQHRARPRAEYSRLKVLFRIILAIPVLIIHYAMQIVAQLGAVIAWFAIVALGRQPKGLQDMIALGTSYQQRAYAYLAAGHRGLAALHGRDEGRQRRGRAGVRRAGLQPTGRGPRAPDVRATRRLRLARARGGLPAPAAPRAARAADRGRRAGRSGGPGGRAVVQGRAGRVRRARGAGARAAGRGA